MKFNRKVALGTLLLLVSTASFSTTVSLDLTSLPSAQGWTFQTSGPTEPEIYSVDSAGSTLIGNSLGTGDNRTGYQITDIINPQRPFTISFRANVPQTEVLDDFFKASALIVFASTGTEFYGIGLNSTLIQAPFFSGQIYPIDGTQFHDYRLEAVPGVGAQVFVDNVFLTSSAPQFIPIPNAFGFGNLTSSEKGYVQITGLSFSQPIAEPQTWCLVLLGCAILWSKFSNERPQAKFSN